MNDITKIFSMKGCKEHQFFLSPGLIIGIYIVREWNHWRATMFTDCMVVHFFSAPPCIITYVYLVHHICGCTAVMMGHCLYFTQVCGHLDFVLWPLFLTAACWWVEMHTCVLPTPSTGGKSQTTVGMRLLYLMITLTAVSASSSICNSRCCCSLPCVRKHTDAKYVYWYSNFVFPFVHHVLVFRPNNLTYCHCFFATQ